MSVLWSGPPRDRAPIRVVCLDCGHHTDWPDLQHERPCPKCDGVSWTSALAITEAELRACIAARGTPPLIPAESDPGLYAEVLEELARDLTRIVGARIRCVGCGGSIEERLAALGSVRCQDCR